MELTKKQALGLDIAIEKYKNKEKYCVISGYAGSGKSTLVRYIVAALLNLDSDLTEEDITYATFTGKAASVLIQKGNKGAKTFHKLLYDARPKPDGTFLFIPKTRLEYKVIIADECSMIPKDMVALLLRHNVFVIFCGDPGQLPPIRPEDNNHLLDNPHIFLDEIMRQAKDSGIIRLSMMIRNGENINGFRSDDAIVLPQKELNTGMLEWGDIVLCATNKNRVMLNNQIRELKGFTGPIHHGEKVIALNNYWDIASDDGNALVNGTIGYLENPFINYFYYPNYIKIPNNRLEFITANFTSETGDNFGMFDMDKKLLEKGESSITDKQRYLIGKSKRKLLLPYQFTLGYTITVWKAQGSEWDKVLCIEEGHPFKADEHRAYLYTAVTRASQKVTLITKN